MRRFLTILAILIVLGGIAAGVYFYFFANTKGGIAVAPAGSGLPAAGNATGGTTPTGGAPATGTAPASPTKVTARLVKIDAGPVVPGEVAVDVRVLPDGSLATSTRAASTTPDVLVSYLERESGNIFSYQVGANKLTRTSNKTIPGIQQASWLPSGATAFVQYLSGTDFSTINTYALPAGGQGGFFLPQDLAGVSVGSSSLLLLASGGNGSIATTEHPDGSGSQQAFATPLSMVRASFAGSSSYLAYTKPSSTQAGYAYLVSAAGHFSRIAGPLPGLVALASPSGTWVLVSSSSGGALAMELVNTKTREVVPLPVATIADKCVWTLDEHALYCSIPTNPSASYAYPDDWYQGAVGFNDKIWKIDVAARVASLALDFSAQTGTTLDATALAIDPGAQELVFLNKNDGALWGLEL